MTCQQKKLKTANLDTHTQYIVSHERHLTALAIDSDSEAINFKRFRDRAHARLCAFLNGMKFSQHTHPILLPVSTLDDDFISISTMPSSNVICLNDVIYSRFYVESILTK